MIQGLSLMRMFITIIGAITIVNSYRYHYQLGCNNHLSRYKRQQNRLKLLDSKRRDEPTPISNTSNDFFNSFSLLDKILFNRFSNSVANELGITDPPSNYQQLISTINELTISKPPNEVNESGKRMLVGLFPSWLLSQYKWMFAKPFPKFSVWMNAWVTHLATNWLMGNSTVIDLTSTEDGTILEEQGLLIEKCRFLETSGCLRTCIHACKIPTQRFFLEEMALPVTLIPNVTDYSCRFEFGVMPVPLAEDPINKSPCLSICTVKLRISASACKI